MKYIKLIGYMASAATLVLSVILIWLNPYFEGMDKVSMYITLGMLMLPGIVFAIGLFLHRSSILLISFIWSFPYSMYMLLTPGIFLMFGITNFVYLLCFVLFRINKIKY
ncbi:ABC-type Fe3+ transport system permease subunit [Paenibacillus forsythiae]|uniref:ABC-type Fe3+ transport system permease subunit n=1 Tax=Paenibacillus forsythiae TaxID=365616 RepID=A0ABU3HEA0_9BACL|nr:ABC-type Fe3+ transport system permease subunit [Paenibacillus forsythiae]